MRTASWFSSVFQLPRLAASRNLHIVISLWCMKCIVVALWQKYYRLPSVAHEFIVGVVGVAITSQMCVFFATDVRD